MKLQNPKYKERLKIILLAYLVFAVTGFFAFSNNLTFQFKNYNPERLASGNFIASAFYNSDCLAENTTTINKAHNNSSSPMRSGLFRIFIFAGIFVSAMFFAKSYNYSVLKNDKIFCLKSNIILKLRI